MFNQMKQLMEMKKRAEELQKHLAAVKVEKSNSSQTLKVTVNGAQQLESISIDASWLSPEKKDALEKSLVQIVSEAFADVQRRAAGQAASLMKDLKGLNIPGL